MEELGGAVCTWALQNEPAELTPCQEGFWFQISERPSQPTLPKLHQGRPTQAAGLSSFWDGEASLQSAHPCQSRLGDRIPSCKTLLGFVLALMFGSVWSHSLTSPSSASTCTLSDSLPLWEPKFLWVHSFGLSMVLLQQLRLWMQLPPSLPHNQ